MNEVPSVSSTIYEKLIDRLLSVNFRLVLGPCVLGPREAKVSHGGLSPEQAPTQAADSHNLFDRSRVEFSPWTYSGPQQTNLPDLVLLSHPNAV